MFFVWCQLIDPFLRYGDVNVWGIWPWKPRSKELILHIVPNGPNIHILYEYGNSSLNPWRRLLQKSNCDLRAISCYSYMGASKDRYHLTALSPWYFWAECTFYHSQFSSINFHSHVDRYKEDINTRTWHILHYGQLSVSFF